MDKMKATFSVTIQGENANGTMSQILKAIELVDDVQSASVTSFYKVDDFIKAGEM